MASDFIPIIVTYSLTRRCNLRCPHCYSDSNGDTSVELKTREAKALIKDVASLGARVLVFDGGEPLLREDLFELVSHARREGLVPVLGTNATLLTSDLAHRLKSAGLKMCAISIDGSTPGIHDSLRGAGAFEEAMNGILACREAGLPFQIDPCLHRGNAHDVAAMIDLAKEIGAEAIEFFDFAGAGRGAGLKDLALTKEQRREVYELLRGKGHGLPIRVIGIPQFKVLGVPDGVTVDCCSAGKSIACVLSDGTVLPCMLLHHPAGNIRQKKFSEIWRTSPVLQMLREERPRDQCGVCPHVDLCGGARCKAADLLGKDPTCWL